MSDWIRRVASWLIEARLLWLTTIVLLVFLLPVLCFQLTEPWIRLTGLLLQLLGISTVLHGISKTRKLFNLPSLFAVSSRWLRSFPRFRLEKGIVRMIEQVGEIDLASRVTARHQAGANATLDDRVRVLESNLRLLDHRLDDLQHQIDQANRQGKEALATERQKREHEVDEIREKLTTTETGGLHVSLMGLTWLMVGLIMSTASLELSRLL